MSAAAETAQRIGRRLAGTAVWYEGRCNWLGPAPHADDWRGTASAPLGSDLYSGTAGVALAMAEIAAVTGDSALRRTAVGAARHAVIHAGRIPSASALGLYSGRAGVALAAARAGLLLGDESLVEGAGGLVGVEDASGSAEVDLISGRAGAVIGLLGLAAILGEAPLVSGAGGVGDEIAAMAAPGRHGRWWASPSISSTGGLTGMAHGASGIGLALLELGQATHEARWGALGLSAFDYERTRFDDAAGNWCDLRVPPEGQLVGRRFMTAWCHGAAGIGLARARAVELGHSDAEIRADAAAALATTAEHVRGALASEVHDWSLCHGLCGAAEALGLGAEALGDSVGVAAGLRADVVDAGRVRYVSPGRPWPGAFGPDAPGLMVGLAGIALFHLRVDHPEVPSALLVRPEDLGRRVSVSSGGPCRQRGVGEGRRTPTPGVDPPHPR